MKNLEPALSKETQKTIYNKIKQSKNKRSKSLLSHRLENLSINSVTICIKKKEIYIKNN